MRQTIKKILLGISLFLVPIIETSILGSWPIEGQAISIWPLVIIITLLGSPKFSTIFLIIIAAIWRDLWIISGVATLISTLALLSVFMMSHYFLVNRSVWVESIAALLEYGAYAFGTLLVSWLQVRLGGSTVIQIVSLPEWGMGAVIVLGAIFLKRRIAVKYVS